MRRRIYAHPWEFGPRKAKELLLTGDAVDADEAYRLGMVSKVFPVDELEAKTLEFARRVAERPTMASLLIKDSVNALRCDGIHRGVAARVPHSSVGHAHWALSTRTGGRRPSAHVEDWRNAKPTSWPVAIRPNAGAAIFGRRSHGSMTRTCFSLP